MPDRLFSDKPTLESVKPQTGQLTD